MTLASTHHGSNTLAGTAPTGRLHVAMPWLVILAAWALVQGCTLFVGQASVVLNGELTDTDSYMRLVRVMHLLNGDGWFSSAIPQSNAPYGEVLHWTRPLDLLILLLTGPLNLLLPLKDALFVAGAAISPLLQLASAMLLAHTARRYIPGEGWDLAAIAFLIQPLALPYALAGRADHHYLLVLIFLAVLALVCRSLSEPRTVRPAAQAGALMGFGLWVSPELMPLLVVVLAGFGFAWLRERSRNDRAFQLFAFCATLLATVVLAVLVERPVAEFGVIEHDKISIVHVVLALLLTMSWGGLAFVFTCLPSDLDTSLRRFLFVSAFAGVSFLVMISVFPDFIAGPMAEVDPRVHAIWLDKVTEMNGLVPITPVNDARFVMHLGFGILVVPWLGLRLARTEGSEDRALWTTVALGVGLFWVLALLHLRFGPYAVAVMSLPLAGVCSSFMAWANRIRSDRCRALLRVGGLMGLLFGTLALGVLTGVVRGNAGAMAAEEEDSCTLKPVLEHLQERYPEPLVVQAFMDYGPEILYRTHHRVIGTPYHRNDDGIWENYAMLARADDLATRELFARRGVDLVLLCRAPSETSFFLENAPEDNLFTRLRDGHPPHWLRPVSLPAGVSETAKLFRVSGISRN